MVNIIVKGRIGRCGLFQENQEVDQNCVAKLYLQGVEVLGHLDVALDFENVDEYLACRC